MMVNDLHSRLNPTRVASVALVRSLGELEREFKKAARAGNAISLAGSRHAMGGQQFGTNTALVDMRGLNRVLSFDRERGTIEVEAGIQWPELLGELLARQRSGGRRWTFAQKQTGADRLTLGGSLSANIHGRGLRMKPFSSDIESFTLFSPEGGLMRCSRSVNRDWFRLAAGGYGLFGPVYSIELRLGRRMKLRREVELIRIESLAKLFQQRIEEGFLYGDFQFAIDPASDDFLAKGVFSCYRPVSAEMPMGRQRHLRAHDWESLIHLAHTHPGRAFDLYAAHYLKTSGQVYWSDQHQMSYYKDDYHAALDRRLNTCLPGSEMITELFVPRERLEDFMAEAREDFRRENVQVIYGTVRLIEREEETFLAWARQPYACVIFNLHVTHSKEGVARASEAFQRLIDMALARNGSFYLTYHRFARADQVLACYPQLRRFMEEKSRRDPEDRVQSDWLRHTRRLVGLK
jgi:FAD/FMN-containing dehydrogenase